MKRRLYTINDLSDNYTIEVKRDGNSISIALKEKEALHPRREIYVGTENFLLTGDASARVVKKRVDRAIHKLVEFANSIEYRQNMIDKIVDVVNSEARKRL